MDNSTALSCLTRWDSRDPTRDNIVKQIFKITRNFNIELSAVHISGILNKEADFLSRVINKPLSQNKYPKMNPYLEWSTGNTTMEIIDKLGLKFNIDLFASFHNYKHNIFCTFKKDPKSSFTNAFTMDWSKFKPFVAPPFNCIQRILNHILLCRAENIIMIAPDWKSQIWYPQLIRMLQIQTNSSTKRKRRRIMSPIERKCKTPAQKTPEVVTSDFIREMLQSCGFSRKSVEHIAKFAWCERTRQTIGTRY